MKAAINGVPHLSIGDGWWAEGFNGSNGWIIEGGAGSDNAEAADAADAAALYRILEEEVIPTFYDRDSAGVPRRWLKIVKEGIRTVAPRFSARRMVKEYAERMYVPALERKLEVKS
jgi:starch phosphorylase